MAMYLTSPDKHVIGRCEIKIEEPSIQRVYWTNEAGEEIDKLIPQSKAILRIETRAWNPKIKLEIELTHKSGEPITTKAKDIKEVSVNKEGIATQQYKWSIEDTIVATVKSVDDKNSKGAVQKQAIDLVKKWGIWINSGDNSEMYYFDSNNYYDGNNTFIKDFYEAYFYLIKSKTAQGIFSHFESKGNDVYIEFIVEKRFTSPAPEIKIKGTNKTSKETQLWIEKAFEAYAKAYSNKEDPKSVILEAPPISDIKNECVAIIQCNTKKGLEYTENNESIVKRSSPAISLIHELAHALEMSLYGVDFFYKCTNIRKIRNYKDLSELRAMELYERLVVSELNNVGANEDMRNNYDSTNITHLKDMTGPTSTNRK